MMGLELNQGVLYGADGEKIGNIGKVDSVEITDIQPDNTLTVLKKLLHTTDSLTITAIPTTQANFILDILPPKDAKWTLQVPVIIPNRRHHKKRIQKKWLKKYGYTESYKSVDVDIRYGDCSGMGQIEGEVNK